MAILFRKNVKRRTHKIPLVIIKLLQTDESDITGHVQVILEPGQTTE